MADKLKNLIELYATLIALKETLVTPDLEPIYYQNLEEAKKRLNLVSVDTWLRDILEDRSPDQAPPEQAPEQ